VKAQRLKPSRLTGSDEPPPQRGGVEVADDVAWKDGIIGARGVSTLAEAR